jgi:hypothetical protein
MQVACDEAEWHRLIGRALNLARTEYPGGIAIQQQTRIASRKILVFLRSKPHFLPSSWYAFSEALPLSYLPRSKWNGCAILQRLVKMLCEANEGDVPVAGTSRFCARWLQRRDVWGKD